eukprot:5082378-Pyramimonas_sp.AAC.1
MGSPQIASWKWMARQPHDIWPGSTSPHYSRTQRGLTLLLCGVRYEGEPHIISGAGVQQEIRCHRAIRLGTVDIPETTAVQLVCNCCVTKGLASQGLPILSTGDLHGGEGTSDVAPAKVRRNTASL